LMINLKFWIALLSLSNLMTSYRYGVSVYIFYLENETDIRTS
jgi:hypothetical protein